MRKVLYLLAILFLASVGRSLAFDFPRTERKIIVFRQDVPSQTREELLTSIKITSSKDLRLINAKAATISSSQVETLRKDPRILRIDPDVEVYALPKQDRCDRYPWLPWCSKPSPTPTPSPKPTPTPTPTPTSSPPTPTPEPGSQTLPWGIARTDADDAWSISTGEGIKVAVIDTGIDRDHPDLDANLAGCLNFISSRKTCEDDNGHGTHVSGIIAAENNSFGIVGVAPDAKIYALKVLNSQGSGYLSDIIEALDWAITNKMNVVNMSLGTTADVVSFREAVERVNAAGIIQVAAGGNSGPGENTVNYPAQYSQVIAVSAVDASDNVPSWSSRGSEIDLAAPGVSIYSTSLSGKYKILSGTSMSAPHVTGTVALRLFLKPGESPSQIEAILENNTDSLPYEPNLVGAGLVNAYQVVSVP